MILSWLHRIALILQTLTIPAPTGYVSDFAGVLDAGSISRMTATIQDLKAKTKAEIAVVTLSSLQGRDPGDVALQIGRAWGVGAKGNPGDTVRNRGIVILLVPRQNHQAGTGEFWIATGLQSEGIVTDAEAGRIRDEVTPELAREDYGDALLHATQLVAQRLAQGFNVTLDSSFTPPVHEPSGRDVGQSPIPFIIIVVLMLLFASLRSGFLPWLLVGSAMSRRNRWGGWGSGGGWGGGGGSWGGGGGGFGEFGGGGGFGGGGAGGSF